MRVRPVVSAWLVLILLTGVAGASADLIGHARLGVLPLLVVAAATLAKTRLILTRYLKLGALPGFLAGFTAAAAFIIAIVTAGLLTG